MHKTVDRRIDVDAYDLQEIKRVDSLFIFRYIFLISLVDNIVIYLSFK